MRADQEIGKHPLALAATGAIFFPYDTGRAGGRFRGRGKCDADRLYREHKYFLFCKRGTRFRPHNIAGDQRTFIEAGPERRR